MPPQPFTEFLLYLRQQGVPVGVSAHLAVAKLLARWNHGDRAALRDALAALLARSAAEQQQIQQLFDFYYPTGDSARAASQPLAAPPADRSPSPPQPPTAQRKRPGWGWLLFGAGILLLAALWGTARTDSGCQRQAVDAGAAGNVGAATPDLGTTPSPPRLIQPAVPPPPQLKVRWGVVAAAVTTFGLAFLALYAARRRIHRRAGKQRWVDAELEKLPGPQLYKWRLHQLRAAVRRDDIEEFVTLLHRLCVEPGAGRHLDVARTVERVARTGQLTTLLLRRQPLRRSIVLLIDCGADTRVFSARLDTLVDGITRRGIPIQRWYFDNDASQIAAAPYGPWQPLASVLGHDQDTPILVMTYGSDLADRSLPLPGWVETLRRFQRCAVLHPVTDPDAWPLRLRRDFPIPVWPMNRLGLRGAAHTLAYDRALRSKVDRTRLRVDTTIDSQSVRGLLRLIALAPHPTVEVAELLRQLYYPQVPEQVLLHIAQATATAGGTQLHLPAEQGVRLLAELRSGDKAKEQAARRTLLDALGDSAPPLGSIAHLRWRLDRALQGLHLSPDGEGAHDQSPERAAAELVELAASPILDEVAEALRALQLPGERAPRGDSMVPVETSLPVEVVRRLANSRDPLRSLPGPAAAGWPRPGVREVVVSLLVTVLWGLGLWVTGGLLVETRAPRGGFTADLGEQLAPVDLSPADVGMVDLTPADLTSAALMPADLVTAEKGSTTPAAGTAPFTTIDSVPPGASVFVDGALYGQSGPNFKIRINKGPHTIRLELDRHKTFDQMVSISGAQKLTFPLEKAPARIDIKFPATNDSARGGEIFVDGAPAGTVPMLVDLPSGRHLIEVRKPGQKAYSETVDVKAAETRAVWVVMQADQRIGSLLIAADVNVAEVLVDGKLRGQAPIVVDNLSEGEHLVEVRRTEPGAQPWRQTVRVAGNQQTKVFAQTTPRPLPQGSLMVVTTVPDAKIFVDGVYRGVAGAPIDLAMGQHSVSVESEGYKPGLKVVDIESGKPRVERIDLDRENKGIGIVRIIMANQVDGAQYFINGSQIDESAALSERGVRVPAGSVVIVVKKAGFGQVRKDLQIAPLTTETVTIELSQDG